jgi:hypothetical protein
MSLADGARACDGAGAVLLLQLCSLTSTLCPGLCYLPRCLDIGGYSY